MLKFVVRSNIWRPVGSLSRCLHDTNDFLAGKEVKEIKIPVPWGHVAGKWWGDTSVQPLIGLHGWEDNAGTFDTLAPLLEVPSFLALDFPGHGLSSHHPLGRPYEILDSVILLRRISKYFQWKTISLMGHSYGSCTSFIYSATFPDSVDTYISFDCARTLMACDPISDFEQLRQISRKLLSLEKRIEAKETPSYGFDQIVDLLHTGSGESPTKESCKILLKRGMLPSLETNSYYFSRDPRLKFHAMGRFPFKYLLKIAPRIKCHHLSIRGLQGFLMEGEREEVYLKTRDLIKKPQYHFEHNDVEGSHHFHLNNPDRIAPIVNNFLNKVLLNLR